MVSTMTVSSATRRLDVARALVPTIRASTQGTEARHELLSQLFETIADAGFLHMALARGLPCPELAGPAASAGLGEPRVSRRSARETPQ